MASIPIMPSTTSTPSSALPAHASPAFHPVSSPQPHDQSSRSTPNDFSLTHNHHPPSPPSSSAPSHPLPPHDRLHDPPHDPPPSLISPAFTPPTTPGTTTPLSRPPTSIPIDHTLPTPPPRLVDALPRVECVVRARIPTTTGTEMYLYLYHNDADAKEHLAIVFGSHIRSRSLDLPRPGETEMDRMIRGAYVGRLHPGRTSSRVDQIKQEERAGEELPSQPHSDAPLVRIHSECYTGETVWSARCDCGEQLDEAARLMSLPSSNGGAIVYLRQEGRGIGLSEKLKAYNLQDLGNDTYEANLLLRHPADARSYGLATAMLVDLGLGGETGIRLLTNNPDKVRAVEGPRQEIVVKERVAMVPLSWRTGGVSGVKGPEVERYLSTKVSFLATLASERIVLTRGVD
ncbi:hypothetical protein P152DRAFT_226642 [Eremomyces bilateralis CBS 781.70]|uniref:GTP cyclohydrolase II n=1 Tax=Eremomyces bilateralis CBS 781.70 TaxID=1392243 RepID=A0A6G1FRG6_9PEZI|nr:uncharacterized protein P152DRAFT_226642 [Eremomyces bilateralis CBS 781.70]KAF1808310.1 hypothetical protein P152DRAFT_226642 [Eremomyces bilateralis CBS 781.70]